MSFEHAELHLSILGMKMSLFILFNFYYMILLILRVFSPSVIEHMFTTTSSLRRMLLSIPQCTCRCCFNFLEKNCYDICSKNKSRINKAGSKITSILN